MLCSLHTPAFTDSLYSSAEAANLTMLTTSLTHPHAPQTLWAPERRLAVDTPSWASAATCLTENGYCMCWWWHLRPLCCGLFLSCRLLLAQSSRLFLNLVLSFFLWKTLLFCFPVKLGRHACSPFHWLVIDSFWFSFGIFVHWKRRRDTESKV